MSEQHAYGTSLGCVSRRIFVLGFAWLLAVLCALQIFRWVLAWRFWDALLGLPVTPEHLRGCTGTGCYEVFTCFGMKDTTQNLREPLVTLAGAFFAPVGIIGGMHGYHAYLQSFALFLAASAALHVGTVAGDAAYFGACNAFPGNMLGQTVFTWPIASGVPLSNAAVDQLRSMAAFPVGQVNDITGGFSLLAWYFSFAGAYALFLIYAAWEASRLAYLAERGPLGLGVHYGMGQWDEVFNHDAIRRHKTREIASQFIEDAKLPSAQQSEAEAALGYGGIPAGYGATAASRFYYTGNLPA